MRRKGAGRKENKREKGDDRKILRFAILQGHIMHPVCRQSCIGCPQRCVMVTYEPYGHKWRGSAGSTPRVGHKARTKL